MSGRTKKRILWAGLGIVLVALVLDRTWPLSAPAAPEPSPAETEAVDQAPVFSDGEPQSKVTRGPDIETYGPRLEAASLWLAKGLQRNPFKLIPEAFAVVLADEPAADSSEEESAGPDGPEDLAPDQFVQRHELHATCVRPGMAFAIVGSRLLRPGQELDGYRLVEVRSHEVTFCRGKDTATLRLPNNP